MAINPEGHVGNMASWPPDH